MNVDVFISYCTRSFPNIVGTVAQKLEANGIRCWYASRDSVSFYGEYIMTAIKNCTVFLLILDQEASQSDEVLNELHYAIERVKARESIVIVPFHIADRKEDMGLESRYYLDRLDWFDGCRPPLDQRINELVEKIKYLLDNPIKHKEKIPLSPCIISNFHSRERCLKDGMICWNR